MQSNGACVLAAIGGCLVRSQTAKEEEVTRLQAQLNLRPEAPAPAPSAAPVVAPIAPPLTSPKLDDPPPFGGDASRRATSH